VKISHILCHIHTLFSFTILIQLFSTEKKH
jgi:hypothetical protein